MTDSHALYRLCSEISREAGDDPCGSANPFDTYLAVEIPPPWHDDVSRSPNFPPGLRQALLNSLDAGVLQTFTALLPEPDYCVPGHTRALLLRRPGAAFARYEKHDYLIPDGELDSFARSLASDDLEAFEICRTDTTDVRDILVCTHGQRDVCCARFGGALYRALRSEYAGDRLRIWRTSHIGGHRFAPTLIDLPEGLWWGHLSAEHLRPLIERHRPARELTPFYRGWSGLKTPFEQLAEREILAREGWNWTNCPRSGRLLEEGDRTARVLIEAHSPHLTTYEALVEPAGHVMTLPSSGTDPLQKVTRYHVTQLQKIAPST